MAILAVAVAAEQPPQALQRLRSVPQWMSQVHTQMN